MIERVTVLHGHVSPDTAYLIEDYPYGRLRCQRRVWIDGPPDKGQYKGQYRVMRQTNNPKRTGPDRPGKYGEGEVGPGGHPWNAPKAGTYTDWIVLYLDEEDHVQAHSGSLIYGLSGPEDARMRLDGTYDQLTADERAIYDRMARIGQRADRWEPWHKALDFIRAYRAEHGTWPSQEDVRQAPGFVVYDHDYDVAIAAARDLPAPGQAAAGPASGPVGQDTALPAAAEDVTGSPAAAADPAAAGAGPAADVQDELAAAGEPQRNEQQPHRRANRPRAPRVLSRDSPWSRAGTGWCVLGMRRMPAWQAVTSSMRMSKAGSTATQQLVLRLRCPPMSSPRRPAALRRTSRTRRPQPTRVQPSRARNPR